MFYLTVCGAVQFIAWPSAGQGKAWLLPGRVGLALWGILQSEQVVLQKAGTRFLWDFQLMSPQEAPAARKAALESPTCCGAVNSARLCTDPARHTDCLDPARVTSCHSLSLLHPLVFPSL